MLGSWVGISVFLVFIPISIILTLGGAIALGLVGMLFGKHSDHTRVKRFFHHFLRGWGWLVCLVWILPWLAFWSLETSNRVAPATLPRITISNGDKTVIFQSMMHIASPGFYEDIRHDMENLESQDYIFFYEGVKSSSAASLEKLSALMGTEVSPEMYDTLADIADLHFQGDDSFIDILPSMNVDLSTDQIVALAEKSHIPAPSAAQTDVTEELKKYYPSFTPFQKSISMVIARGIMNLLLRTYTRPGLTTELKAAIPVFQVVLDERNKNLTSAIESSPSKHIYIHYGALHYPGVLALLRAKDPRWQEIARTNFSVIR